MGLMLAEPGFHTRCWVEIEEHPRACLIAGQRAGYFAPAPIWDDITTFDGRPWRGLIDTILAGYPCQPFSAAGQRRGEEDERHLWPDVERVIREIDARWIFLENVEGHLSLGLDVVLADLRRLGYRPAAGLFSSEETRGSQVRKRVFIVCHSDEHGAREKRKFGSGDLGRNPGDGGRRRTTSKESYGEVAIGARIREREPHNPERPEPRQDTRTDAGRGGLRREVGNACGEHLRSVPGEVSGTLGRAGGSGISSNRENPCRPGENVGNAFSSRCEGGEQPGAHSESAGAGAHGSVAQPGRPFLSPPLPGDVEAWRAALDVAPDLAPAVSYRDLRGVSDIMAKSIAAGLMGEAEAQSRVCRMAHAMAARPRALRLLGNGVDPLAAGHAWRTLGLAHGLRPLDLAAGHAGEPVR